MTFVEWMCSSRWSECCGALAVKLARLLRQLRPRRDVWGVVNSKRVRMKKNVDSMQGFRSQNSFDFSSPFFAYCLINYKLTKCLYSTECYLVRLFFLSIYLSIYLSIVCSFYLSVCLSIYPSISIYHSLVLSIYLYIYLSMSVCLSIYLFNNIQKPLIYFFKYYILILIY